MAKKQSPKPKKSSAKKPPKKAGPKRPRAPKRKPAMAEAPPPSGVAMETVEITPDMAHPVIPPAPPVVENPPDADPEAVAVAATMAANGLASDAGFTETDHEKVPHVPEGAPGNQ